MKISKLLFLTSVLLITICTDIVPARSPKEKRAGKKVRNKKLPSNNNIVQKFENIHQIPKDRRSYKGLKLSNGLKVLIVSDPSVEKSTVCFGIHMGSLNDFVIAPGLANFVGHMVLLSGDRRYAPNDFAHFVETHGGKLYIPITGMSEQKLLFEIKHRYLAESLGRFADIFIQSGLLNDVAEENVLQQAKNAASQEYALRKSNIEYQILEVEKSLSKKNSMFNHFFYGIPGALYKNGEVVGLSMDNETLYKHVQTFYKTWCSSNLMNLVVIQREKNFEELEEVIASSFGCIENKRIEQKLYEYPKHHPWGPEQLKKIVHIVGDVQSLRLMFPAPYDMESRRKMLVAYISHYLAYNGKGSLRSLLRKKNFCTDLRLELFSTSGISFLKIVCDITDFGMNHLYLIIYLIFQYIDNMMNADYEKEDWVLAEIMKIDELKCNNYDNNDLEPNQYAQTLASLLQIFPFEDVLTYGYVRKQWNPKQIKKLIECLGPSNMNIIIISKQFLAESMTYTTEKYLGLQYSVSNIPDKWIQIWNNKEYVTMYTLEPPQRNPFLPEKFDVYSLGEGEPKDPYIIRKSSKSEIWFKQDDHHRIPKMWLHVEIISSTADIGPFKAILWCIFVQLINSSLEEEYSHFTRQVFLVWSLTVTDGGLRVHTYGYNDKLSVLLEKILSKMVSYGNKMIDYDKEEFIKLLSRYRESIQEKLRCDQADSSDSLTKHLMNAGNWSTESLLQATRNLKFEDVKKFSNQAFRRIFIRSLIYGNCTNGQAKEIASMIEEQFRSSSGMLQQELILPKRRRRVKIADGSDFIYQVMSKKKNVFNTYSFFFQLQTMSSKSLNVKSLLLTQIISNHLIPSSIDDNMKEPPVIKSTTLEDTNGILGFFIKVQSSKRYPNYIDKRVERFLHLMTENIINMSNTELESFKKAVEMKTYKKPSKLMVLSEEYWNEISNRHYNFNRYEEELRLLHALTVEEVQDFFQETFGSRRRKLAVHIFPEDSENNKQYIKNFSNVATLITTSLIFKTSSGLLAMDYLPAK